MTASKNFARDLGGAVIPTDYSFFSFGLPQDSMYGFTWAMVFILRGKRH